MQSILENNIPLHESRLIIAGDTKYWHSRKLTGHMADPILQSAGFMQEDS